MNPNISTKYLSIAVFALYTLCQTSPYGARFFNLIAIFPITF